MYPSARLGCRRFRIPCGGSRKKIAAASDAATLWALSGSSTTKTTYIHTNLKSDRSWWYTHTYIHTYKLKILIDTHTYIHTYMHTYMDIQDKGVNRTCGSLTLSLNFPTRSSSFLPSSSAAAGGGPDPASAPGLEQKEAIWKTDEENRCMYVCIQEYDAKACMK